MSHRLRPGQSLPGIDYSGSFRLVILTVMTLAPTTSITAALDFDATADFGNGFGGYLGYEGIRELDANEETVDRVLYALTYTGEVGTFALGNPRGASEVIRDNDLLGASTVLAIEGYLTLGPLPTLIQFLRDDAVYGLSYEGAFGANTVAASYHIPEESDDAILSFGYSRDFGSYGLFATYDTTTDNPAGYDGTLSIGASGHVGDFAGQVTLSSQPIVADDGFVIQLEGDYRVNDALRVGASLARLDTSGGDFSVYSIGAEYGFGTGGFARADLGGLDGGSDVNFASIEVGITF